MHDARLCSVKSLLPPWSAQARRGWPSEYDAQRKHRWCSPPVSPRRASSCALLSRYLEAAPSSNSCSPFLYNNCAGAGDPFFFRLHDPYPLPRHPLRNRMSWMHWLHDKPKHARWAKDWQVRWVHGVRRGVRRGAGSGKPSAVDKITGRAA